MWDHYLFTGDKTFLAQQAYPAMKEAAEFTLSSLVEIPAGLPFAGRLVTNPSTSPANVYKLEGKQAHLTYAPTMDLKLIGEPFENTRTAARIMGKDAGFSARLQTTQTACRRCRLVHKDNRRSGSRTLRRPIRTTGPCPTCTRSIPVMALISSRRQPLLLPQNVPWIYAEMAAQAG